jgi:hypothetical protein
MHEAQQINQSIGYVLCIAFPALVVAMTVAYAIKERRDRARRERERDGKR